MRWIAIAVTVTIRSILWSADLAQAQGAQNCEALKDDDAFNKCLAASGPTRRAPSANAPASTPVVSYPNDGGSGTQYGPLKRARESAARARLNASRWQVQRLKGGRVRMIIPVSGRKR